MKERRLDRQCLSEKESITKKVLVAAALAGALSLGSPSEGLAQNRSTVQEGANVTEVTKLGTEVEDEKTISLETAMQELQDSTGVKSNVEKTTKTPTKFTVSTGVGYSIGGDIQWVNRIQGSGEVFQGTPFSTKITGIADLDNPMHSKGSGKLIIGKSIYKGISLDGDYTFTGTGGNIFRFGIGYTGTFGKGVYGIKLFPLNTNGSPISAKVFVSTKVGKNGELSSFVLVDFGKGSYYGETEYNQKIAEGIGLFLQARLGGKLDGRFGEGDSQSILGGLRFDIK